MTVDQAKQALLTWVSEQVGYHEGSSNYNRYADDPRLEQLYGWNAQHQPWCDLFTDAAFIHVFGLELGAAMTYQKVGSGSAACRTSASFFREHGALVSRPEPGDVVFFYANGDINHQGIVIRVYGGSVVTVEGNSSDQVSERVYQVGDSYIAGYGRPNWKLVEDIPADNIDVPAAAADPVETKPEPVETVEPVEIELPVLRNGMGGGAVAMMQGALVYNKCSLPLYGADGEFGVETQTALRNFQTRKGLEPTGVCDKETWEALRG